MLGILTYLNTCYTLNTLCTRCVCVYVLVCNLAMVLVNYAGMRAHQKYAKRNTACFEIDFENLFLLVYQLNISFIYAILSENHHLEMRSLLSIHGGVGALMTFM